MSSRTFFIIQTVFYLAVLGGVTTMVRRPNVEVVQLLKEHYEALVNIVSQTGRKLKVLPLALEVR
ncbi:MAG: hypothetical protein H7257_07835 [Taibaiella sp.]|nr:hypothetical protein [Taibaiella sp.]